MLTDYKFWYIKRDDNGFITEVAVRFYEGEIVLEVPVDKPEVGAIPTYKRTKLLKPNDLPQHSDKRFVRDFNGNDCCIYNQTHFSNIKTTDELRVFLKSELIKDPTRTPISQQVEEKPK